MCKGIAVVIGADGYVANLDPQVEGVIEGHRHFERVEIPEPVEYKAPSRGRRRKGKEAE